MKKIIPFSNETEAMHWMDHNCDVCRRSNCTAKVALQKGFVSGYITEKMAWFIGYSYHEGELAYHGREFERLNIKCNQYSTVRISPAKKMKPELTPKLF